jgi:hypothetical protein
MQTRIPTSVALGKGSVEESVSLCVVSSETAVVGVSRGPKTILEGVNWDRVVVVAMAGELDKT